MGIKHREGKSKKIPPHSVVHVLIATFVKRNEKNYLSQPASSFLQNENPFQKNIRNQCNIPTARAFLRPMQFSKVFEIENARRIQLGRYVFTIS